MKTLISAAGTFGPFRVVQPLEDHFLCDGVKYQFDTIGAYTLSDGAPEPAVSPRSVPKAVPMLNARIAMSRAGWLAPWEDFLASLGGQEGDEARIKWVSALTVRRDDPLVAIGIAALGKTEEEADQLFLAADALNP